MADTKPASNLKSFDAYADENGQAMGQDSPTDLARPDVLRRRMDGDPSGESETVRLASGRPGQNADDETAAETPAATLKQISDPSLPGNNAAAGDAVERATAGLGKPD